MTGTFAELLLQHKGDIDRAALCPYAHLVPKQPEKNKEWREWIAKCGETDKTDRELILDACRIDLSFFINSFLVIKQESPVPADLPFILWDKQEKYVRMLVETRRLVEADQTGATRGDVGCDKPREVGASWLTLAEGLQMALFVKGHTGIIGSRVEADVDQVGASKSLFFKLDYYMEHLPRWFVPEKYWSKTQGYPTPAKACRSQSSGRIRLTVPGAGTILGGTTQENFGRSGRFGWMMLDEFAHTDRGQHGMGDKIWGGTMKTCRLRRCVSTPNGRTNKFADLRFGHDGTHLRWFTFEWTDDPRLMENSYPLTVPLQIGPLTLPAGGWWSPAMESSRASMNNDALFAQEMLLSYEGIGSAFYEGVLPVVKIKQLKKPVWRGDIILSGDPKRPRIVALKPNPDGLLALWEPFDPDHFTDPSAPLFPRRLYACGNDIAAGSRDSEGRGASNSVSAIGRIEADKVTKIAEYVVSGLSPHLFARYVCALGWEFRGMGNQPAYAIWEHQGPGEYFGPTLIRELDYPHYYSERTADRSFRPGFHMATHRSSDGNLVGSKVNAFNLHLEWIQAGFYEEPSFDTYREMEQYRRTEDGAAEHHAVRSALDPGVGRKNHGDAVIATVLMVWAAKKLQDDLRDEISVKDPPKMSMAWVHQKVRREKAGVWR